MFEKQHFQVGFVLGFVSFFICHVRLEQSDGFYKPKDFHEVLISNINMYCY